MPRRPLPAAARHGFTLIELMITVVVITILMAVAIPSYQDAMRRNRRSDAMTALSTLMQAQERFRANNASYYEGSISGLIPGNAPDVSPNGHYTLSIDQGATGAGYTARATARSSSPQIDDTACRALLVTVANGNTTYASESTGGANSPDRCWVK